MTEFVLWYIAVELLGLAALPLAMAALPRLADRGYGLAKVLGVLLITFCNYLLGSVLKLGNNAPLLVLCMALLCAVGLVAQRDQRAELRHWLRAHRTAILTQEMLFLALFAAWAMVRAAHPGVLSTEKPMDLALMTATHKATAFPPYDPWLSGTSINYYYGGYLAVGGMVTLTGVAPTVGYNLGVALVFALAGVSAYAVIYSLTRSVRWSLLAPVFVLLVGNLDGLSQFLNPAVRANNFAGFNFFNSSRIITAGYNIDEFPAFSFLLGDLHPHVIGLPFTILAIGVALNLALAAQAGWRALAPDDLRRATTLLLAGLVVGALYFINSWDWPSYLLLTVAALLVPGLARLTGRLLSEGLGLGLAVVALSYLLYLEYRHDFQPQYSSVGVRFHGSPTDQVLTMFGLFLAPVAVFIVGMFWQRATAGAPEDGLAPYDRAPEPHAAMAPAGAAMARSAASTALPSRRMARSGAATVVLDREPTRPTTPSGLNDDLYDEDGDSAAEDDEQPEEEAPWDPDLPRLPTPSFRSRQRRNGKGKGQGQAQKARRGRASASAEDAVSPRPDTSIVQGRDGDGARAREDVDGFDADDAGDNEDAALPRLPVPSFMARNKRQRAERDGRQGQTDSSVQSPRLRPNGGAIALVVSAVLLWGLLSVTGTFGTMGLLLPFMVAALYLAWREGRAARPINAFALLLCAGGIALIIACDTVYLRDNFCSPDASGTCTSQYYRMNTVFKLYYQAWTLLALGAVYGLWMLWTRLRGSIARFLAPGGAAAVIATGGVYTVLGLFTPTTNAYTNPAAFTDPTAAATLDGASYLRHYVHQPLTAADASLASAAEIAMANRVANAIPADAAAIDWISHNVQGHPTLLEADVAIGVPNGDPLVIQNGPEDYWPYPGDAGRELLMYRVSTFTGLADVLGSGYSHEGLWHGGQAVTDKYYDVGTRFNDVHTMYTSGDSAVVGGLLRHYGVDYIYLGGAELYAYYNGSAETERSAVARFKQLGYGVRYSAGGVTILSVAHPTG